MFQSKLVMPLVGGNIVRRRKIEEKLRKLPDYKFAFISAPAGYGKTTAVADFLKRASFKYAWLSIDENDNDPVRFWRGLLASVSRVLSDEGILKVSADEALISSNITADLFIDTVEKYSERFVLVLDDYQLISNRTVLDSIEYLVRYMPPRNMSLIILGRKEPASSLALLCARGVSISLNARDLAFSSDEAAEFFSSRGLKLTADEIDAIERHTEGWAAGLVAAFLSLKECGTVNDSFSALSSRNKNIALILEKDVYDHLTDETRSFLVHTSFLDRFSGSLCAAVTGNIRSAELLLKISESNGFVVPLDSENLLYRYHHLFREFLQSRLEQEGDEVKRGLFKKAGAWCLDHDQDVEAAEWFIKAREYAAAYPIVLKYRAIRSEACDYSQWKKWVDAIPESMYEDDPGVYITYSWIALMESQIDLAEQTSIKGHDSYERIRSSVPEDIRPSYEALLAFSKMSISIHKMDVERTFRDYETLKRVELKRRIALGDFNFNESSLLKTIYGFKGRLSVVERYEAILDSLSRIIGDFSSYIAVIIGEMHYERNEMDRIVSLLTENMGSITELNMPGVILPSFLLLAKAKAAKGDVDGAFRKIIEARKLLAGRPGSVWNYHLDVHTAALHIRLGDLDNAARYMDFKRLGLYDPLSSVREYEYILYARFLMLTKHTDDALILLGRLTNFAKKENQLGRQIEILCLEALCYARKGDSTGASAALYNALALGAGHGYVRTFADEEEPMAQLLERYVKSVRDGAGQLAYARSLMDAARGYAGILKEYRQKQSAGKQKMGARFLTSREIEILGLLAERYSNEDIAKKLFYSLSGVKRCNTRIFTKLGVRDRHEAVEKATKLGLI